MPKRGDQMLHVPVHVADYIVHLPNLGTATRAVHERACSRAVGMPRDDQGVSTTPQHTIGP